MSKTKKSIKKPVLSAFKAIAAVIILMIGSAVFMTPALAPSARAQTGDNFKCNYELQDNSYFDADDEKIMLDEENVGTENLQPCPEVLIITFDMIDQFEDDACTYEVNDENVYGIEDLELDIYFNKDEYPGIISCQENIPLLFQQVGGNFEIESIPMLWSEIEPGENRLYVIEKEDIPITEINLNTVDREDETVYSDVEMMVSAYQEKPEFLEALGDVENIYSYLQIETLGITNENINNNVIEFYVDSDWIDANNIDPETITLYRMTNQGWTDLATTMVPDRMVEGYQAYESITDGFSYFAIYGEEETIDDGTDDQQDDETQEPPMNGEDDQTDENGEEDDQMEEDNGGLLAGINTGLLVGGVVVLAIIVILVIASIIQEKRYTRRTRRR
ncbi:MAG: PGF-pre-PGF domain-containing protein [Candidatus Woesearchaeota archaeon]